MDYPTDASDALKAGINPQSKWPFKFKKQDMKFSPSNNHDRESLLAFHKHFSNEPRPVDPDELADAERRQDEADQILAAALRGNHGVPVTEAFMFGEMACADPSEPMQPLFELGVLNRMWQRVRDHLKAWASWLTAPKPDLS